MVTGIDDIVLESNILINDPTAETVDASITFSNTTTTYNEWLLVRIKLKVSIVEENFEISYLF